MPSPERLRDYAAGKGRRSGWRTGAVPAKTRAMLRISELKLPLGHPPEAMAPAIVERLGIAPEDLLSHVVARRAHDARRKAAILMIYSVDVELSDEAAVLERFKGDHHVRVRPDTDYRFVAKAPEAVVEAERAKLAALREERDGL